VPSCARGLTRLLVTRGLRLILLEFTAVGLAWYFSFHTTKYPPSLLYLLMTLGPTLVILHAFRMAKGPVAGMFVTFGRVPFFFYVTHLYLIHAIAVAAGVAQAFPASSLMVLHGYGPKGFGFGLPMIYLVWLAVVPLLYPLCRRYAELKARSRAWWLSYL